MFSAQRLSRGGETVRSQGCDVALVRSDESPDVLYFGEALVWPFAETFLRAPVDPDVLCGSLLQKRAAIFKMMWALRPAKLHDPGIGWSPTTVANIATVFDLAKFQVGMTPTSGSVANPRG